MEDILFKFRADGAGDVVSALKSIQQAGADAARAQEMLGHSGAGAGRAIGQGAGGARRGLTDLQKIALKVAADQERAAKRAAVAQERAAAQAAAATKKAGLESEKAYNKQATAAERAAERAAAATKRAEEKRWREVERTSAKIQRELDRELAHAERNSQRRAQVERRASGRAFDRAGSWVVSGLTGLAGDALGVVKDTVGTAARGALETKAIANRVAINGRMPGQEGVDPSKLAKEFENVSVATPGVSAQDVGKAAQAYVDLTGDIDTARSSLQTWATVASASGAAVEDVATAAASLGKHFGVKTQEDVKKVFSILIAQGKGGAMTMHDMASQLQRLAAAGKAFNIGEGVEGVAKLGGILQVARSATGSPRMAATAVENMFRQMDAKSAKLGIKQYDKTGKKMDAYENIAAVIAKEGGSDIGAKHAGVNKFFGAQGARGANPLVTAYEEASRGKKGVEAENAGRAAVIKTLNDAAKTATSWAEVEQDAAQAQKDASAQLQGAWSQLEATAAEKLAPALAALAGQIKGGAVLDGFIAAIKIAADALTAFGGFAQKMGWITGDAAGDKATAAGKAEADARKKMVALGGEKGERLKSLTPEQREEYDAYKGVVDAAPKVKSIQQDRATQAGWSSHLIKSGRTYDEVQDLTKREYAAAGGSEFQRVGMEVPLLGGLANMVANLFGRGETAEQREIRETGDARGSEIDKTNGWRLGTDPEGQKNKSEDASANLAAAMERAAKAADAASNAMSKIAPAHTIAPGASH